MNVLPESEFHTDGVPVRPGEDQPYAPLNGQPVEGDVFDDGTNPGYSWMVTTVENGVVELVMSDPDGLRTEAFMRWPLNRWVKLQESQRLSLRETALVKVPGAS